MASGQEKSVAIAEVWAEAVMALAAETSLEDVLLDELQGLVSLLDREPGFEALLASPLADQEEKRRLLEKALRGRVSDLLVDALQVMRRKQRLDLLRAVAHAYRELWLERRQHVEVRVATAIPLDDKLRDALRAATRRMSGLDPILVERVEPDLVGGLVVRIGDRKFDGSVARELGVLEDRLLTRASYELLSKKSYISEIPSGSSEGDVSS